MSSQLMPPEGTLASAASFLRQKFVKIITMQGHRDKYFITVQQKTFGLVAREDHGSPYASRIRTRCRDCVPRAVKPLKSS
jgi:hypothetical protein